MHDLTMCHVIQDLHALVMFNYHFLHLNSSRKTVFRHNLYMATHYTMSNEPARHLLLKLMNITVGAFSESTSRAVN